MAGFSFPPPPPPPPKPASGPDEGYQPYGSQQSGRGGRGRGNYESRGRGQTRGRGTQDFRGRGNANMTPLNSNAHSRGGGGQRPYDSQGAISSTYRPYQDPRPSSRDQASFHPGAHVNPNFTGQDRQPTGTLFSYVSEPSSDNPSTYAYQGTRPGQNQSRSGYFTAKEELSRTHAGHKRKLEALRGSQESPREQRLDPPAALSVPSFGAPILPAPLHQGGVRRSSTQGPPLRSNGPKTSGKSIGLTPRDNDVEPDEMSGSGEEDNDVDEEAQFAELGTKLAFEHNGEVLSLNNEADLALWKEERRKKWPTSNRVAEREDDRKRIGAERKRLLAAVALIHRPPRAKVAEERDKRRGQDARFINDREPPPTAISAHPNPVDDAGLNATSPAGELVLNSLLSPPKDVHSISNVQAPRDHPTAAALPQSQNEGDRPDNVLRSMPRGLPGINMEDTDDEDTTMEDAAQVEPAPQLSSSDSSSSESDDDEPPEKSSTRQTEPLSSHPQRPVCRYFAASGRCRDGETCRFRHELSSKAPLATTQTQYQPPKTPYDRFAPKLDQPTSTGRKSIHERLVEQEQLEEDRLTLQAIKALGEAGFFKAAVADGR